MEPPAVAHRPLLDEDARARAVESVFANREAWVRRYPGLPAFTLGAASYLDAEVEPGRYLELAEILNPLLERDFGWLYDLVLPALADHLGGPVSFAPAAARPGFHIFLAHPAFRRPMGRIHFDLQYENIAWTEDDGVDISRPFSFTVAIRLPAAGAGLETWDIEKAEHDALPDCEETRVRRIGPSRFVPYEEGGMVCHSGLLLHRIAPARDDLREDDMRITLQGHGLPSRDGHLIYW